MTSFIPPGHALAVFGGSGATGRAVIRLASGMGMQVRTLVRHPSSLGLQAEGLAIIAGSLQNQADVEWAMAGCEAVCCLFGQRPPYTDIFCENATRTILAAMDELGIKRFVCQTGGMVGAYPVNRTLPFRIMTSIFNRRLPETAQDRIGQESAIAASSLDWTIIKPPRLVNRPATGKYTAGPDVRLGLFSCITLEDLAGFLLYEIFAPAWINKAVFIKNI